ncbi:hypothetical protein [Leuconostoc lactis]|uniref:hypothetical protein n=1 Tax=Leuconostoc lactis TaxID=1246 RepID=UPI002FDF84B6
MDLISYKSGGLEYFEAKYGYMSDKAIKCFRELLVKRELERIDEDGVLPDDRANQRMNKYRDEIIEIIEDMRSRGYTPKETASYLNGYQNDYTYGNREIVGYFYRERQNGRNKLAQISSAELKIRRQDMMRTHKAGRYSSVKLSNYGFAGRKIE